MFRRTIVLWLIVMALANFSWGAGENSVFLKTDKASRLTLAENYYQAPDEVQVEVRNNAKPQAENPGQPKTKKLDLEAIAFAGVIGGIAGELTVVFSSPDNASGIQPALGFLGGLAAGCLLGWVVSDAAGGK